MCVFSPQGRIYQTEYAFTAVKGPPHLTSVGVMGQNCVAVVCQKKVPDRFIRAEHVSHTFQITDNIGCVIVGRPGDIMPRLYETRQIAEHYWGKFGHEISISYLARRLADRCQVATQLGWVRLLGVACILFGVEKDDDGVVKPRLYKVDPAGVSLGFFGVSIGHKEMEALNVLEKAHKREAFPTRSTESTILAALGAAQQAIGGNFTANDVELSVAYVPGSEPEGVAPGKPVLLNAAQIDEMLSKLAEQRAG